MSQEIADLEKLVADATLVLHEAEQNLQRLVQAAWSKQAQLLNGHAPDTAEAAARLQQIGQKLAQLSEQNKALQIYLQNGLAFPTSDELWPRIRVLQSLEEERTQLARDLEDRVGQLLANAVFELASSRHLLASGKDEISEGLDALQRELEQGLTDIRHFVTDLEPASILNNFGLGGGIRRYLEQYELRTGLATQLRINTNLDRLPSLIELAIFRVIQEALQNVQRHAQAQQVEIIIEERDGLVEFHVSDDGAGFVPDRVNVSKKNLGLARMMDYATLLNGKLRILSDPGQGTRVILSVPYQSL
jgi:signal transduction histidine kinase